MAADKKDGRAYCAGGEEEGPPRDNNGQRRLGMRTLSCFIVTLLIFAFYC